jgi:hypothetical protein
MPNDQVVYGAASPTSAKPSRTYREERVCAEEDCQTLLSRYNSGTTCSIHRSGWAKPFFKGHR